MVIITRNRPEVLADCLAHLDRQSHREFEVVVVDSSNNDKTADLMRSRPEAIYIRISGGRNNMPQARNVGISRARGGIVAFIDDDCMVSPDWLAGLISGYDHPSIGGVGGSVTGDSAYVNAADARVGIIQPDGVTIRNFGLTAGAPRDVEWLSGGNMSFTRAALAVSGGFDPSFTGDNSYEETDHATRVRQAGFRLRFVPQASVLHLSVARNSDVVSRHWENPARRFYQTRNRTYFNLKNFGWRWAFWQHSLREAKGLTVYAVKKPSAGAWQRWGATLLGYGAGVLAWLAHWLR